MRILIFLSFVLVSSFCFSQKKNSFQVKGLPVREGTLYRPVAKINEDLRQPVDGAEIETNQDSCFALTRGNVSAVFNLGDEFACVVRYSNNLLVTYAGLGNVFLTKGQLIEKGMLVGLLNKTDNKNILTFMMTNQKGSNLGFDKIAAFIKKNMTGSYSSSYSAVASIY